MAAATVKTIGYHDNLNVRAIPFLIGDGSTVLTTTVPIKGAVEVPYACTIIAARIFSLDGISGAIAVSIWKDTYANFPPIAADIQDTFSIAASGVKSEETGLSIAVAAGDIIFYNVDSVTSFKHVLVSLTVTV
ncbi:MAG: hypothetical protein ACYDG4_15240 [Desulfuromonadaceae bacterium]